MGDLIKQLLTQLKSPYPVEVLPNARQALIAEIEGLQSDNGRLREDYREVVYQAQDLVTQNNKLRQQLTKAEKGIAALEEGRTEWANAWKEEVDKVARLEQQLADYKSIRQLASANQKLAEGLHIETITQVVKYLRHYDKTPCNCKALAQYGLHCNTHILLNFVQRRLQELELPTPASNECEYEEQE